MPVGLSRASLHAHTQTRKTKLSSHCQHTQRLARFCKAPGTKQFVQPMALTMCLDSHLQLYRSGCHPPPSTTFTFLAWGYSRVLLRPASSRSSRTYHEVLLQQCRGSRPDEVALGARIVFLRCHSTLLPSGSSSQLHQCRRYRVGSLDISIGRIRWPAIPARVPHYHLGVTHQSSPHALMRFPDPPRQSRFWLFPYSFTSML